MDDFGGTYRQCDTCGLRFIYPAEFGKDSRGVVQCLAFCYKDAGQNELDRSRAIAAAAGQLREAPPPPGARPPAYDDTWREEAELFNVMAVQGFDNPNWDNGAGDQNWASRVRAGLAPQGRWEATSGAGAPVQANHNLAAAYETVDYLYNLLQEAGRPTGWDTPAKAKIAQLCIWLLGKQFGYGWDAAATDTEYGAFSVTSGTAATIYSEDVAGGGRALTQGYAVLSDEDITRGGAAFNGGAGGLTRALLLECAKRAALCLRRMQCGGKRTTNFSATSDQGSGRRDLGFWTHSMQLGACPDDVPVTWSYESGLSGAS